MSKLVSHEHWSSPVSYDKNNKLVIAALLSPQLQCCYNKMSAQAGQLRLAPQGFYKLVCVATHRPSLGRTLPAQHLPAIVVPTSSTAYGSPSTGSTPLLQCTAIMPVRGVAKLQAVQGSCAARLSCRCPQPSAVRANPEFAAHARVSAAWQPSA